MTLGYCLIQRTQKEGEYKKKEESHPIFYIIFKLFQKLHFQAANLRLIFPFIILTDAKTSKVNSENSDFPNYFI